MIINQYIIDRIVKYDNNKLDKKLIKNIKNMKLIIIFYYYMNNNVNIFEQDKQKQNMYCQPKFNFPLPRSKNALKTSHTAKDLLGQNLYICVQ